MKPSLPSDPSTHPQPTPERDSKGRFTKGNPGGPGNPFARQVARLRSTLVNTITEADMVRIAEDLLVKARMGDLAAIKLIFLYVLRKPAETVNPDTLDIEEWQQTIKPLPDLLYSLPDTMQTVPAGIVNGFVRLMQPFVVDKLAQTVAGPSSPTQSAATPSPKQKPEQQDDPADTLPFEPASPSANGGNRHKKPARGPSPNGGNGRQKMAGQPSTNDGNGHTKPLPHWLAEIAAKMAPPSVPRGKGNRGRAKRG